MNSFFQSQPKTEMSSEESGESIAKMDAQNQSSESDSKSSPIDYSSGSNIRLAGTVLHFSFKNVSAKSLSFYSENLVEAMKVEMNNVLEIQKASCLARDH